MGAKKITVDIPNLWEIEAEDHHDFWLLKKAYEKIGLDVNFKEIEKPDSAKYLALFWVGKRPDGLIEKYLNDFI